MLNLRYSGTIIPLFDMTDRFLTLTEAQQHTGKSRSTLRRFVEGIVKADSADRILILPTAAEVAELKENNQPFSWQISEALLDREFRSEAEKTSPSEADRGVTQDDRIVTVLEKTVAVLQEELIEKNRQIAAFQERQREQNLLMKNLHEQLALAAPASHRSPSTEAVIDSRESNVTGQAKAPTKPEKKSFWQREFHLFGRRQQS